MNRLIQQHLTAENAGDTAGAVAMYTDDVVHDVVGAPTGPLTGPEAAQGFYEYLTSNVTVESMDVNRSWYGEDFCVVEHQWKGAVPGEFLGVPGQGRAVDARMLHIWEFKDGQMSRENIWLDGGTIIAQLTGA
ncbi:MAG: nuclear transport factor 2 family protein [Geodermatophilaceae bacterium]